MRPSSGSWSILKSPVCSTTPAGGADGDGERIGDRVVDGDELELERAELLALALLHGERVRRDAVLLELRLDEREGQREPISGMSWRSLSRYGTAPMWSSWPCVSTTPRMSSRRSRIGREVGQDQVDARLVLLGEEHAAVDDEELAVELEDGHVAADLAETAERG